MSERLTVEPELSSRSPRPPAALSALLQVLAVLAAFAAAGALAGVVWEWVWTPPEGLVLDGEFLLDGEGLRSDFSGTGLYVTIATLTGVLVGAGIAVLTERRELLVLVVAAAGSLVAGWLMLQVGYALDPPDPRPLAASAPDYTELPDELHVEGRSPWVAFPGGALMGLTVVFLCLARRSDVEG